MIAPKGPAILDIMPHLHNIPEWLTCYCMGIDPLHHPKFTFVIDFKDVQGNHFRLAHYLTKGELEFYWSTWMLDPVEWVEHLRKNICPTMGDSLVLHGGWLLKRL